MIAFSAPYSNLHMHQNIMPKPTEVDPLLPQTEPSPEISGSGWSRPKFTYKTSEVKYNDPVVYTSTIDEEEPTVVDTTRSAWSTIIASFTFVVFFAFVVSLLSPRTQWGQPGPEPVPTHPLPAHTIGERVHKILTETPLIDGHNDLAIFIREVYKNEIYQKNFTDKFVNGGFPGDVDLAKLKEGMSGGAFWSAFVVCPENASDDFSDAQYSTAVAHTLQQIDLIRRLQGEYKDRWTPAGTDLDTMIDRFHATRSLFGAISIEGLHQVPQTAGMTTLRLYYDLGVRAATLTWNCHNAFADAALISTRNGTHIAPYHRGGLTKEGRVLVKEMNRLGMLVDVSHTSYWTQKAVMSNGTSRAPVIFSHSSAFELCPHPRNVKDDVLELVKETRSIVMVNFSPDFISCVGDGETLPKFYPQNNTLHQVARHVVYMGEKIGYGYVGIGSDFDGMGDLKPKGLEGVDKFPDLVAELLRMGVSDEDVSKVVGGNLLRVWKEAEDVAQKMKREGTPVGQDEICGYDIE